MLRSMIPFLLLALLAACTPRMSPEADPGPAAAPSLEPLRVMSFNLRLNTPSDGDDAWPHRRDRAAALIRRHEVDVVGVQEALSDQLDDLTARLPGYRWVGVGRDDGAAGGEFTAIFFATDRLEVEAHDTFWLSPTPDVPGSIGWDAAITRTATWARLRDRATGRRFVFVNTHFDHRGVDARFESAVTLAEQVPELRGDLPGIVVGDFNATPDAPPYQVLSRVFRDARTLVDTPEGPAGTWSGFEEGGTPLDRRIDYVFVTEGVQVARYGTVVDIEDGRYVSDHLPVWADVAF